MKFVALPVGQGDAFYAETDDRFQVLVDGGRSRLALPNLFRTYAESDRVDALVCTHNDADHANGVIGFLEHGLSADELWLPATWLDALQSLPEHAHETLGFLWEHIRELAPERLRARAELPSQEAAWGAIFPEWDERRRPQPEAEDTAPADDSNCKGSLGDALRDVVDALDDHLETLTSPFAAWRRPWPLWYGDERDALVSAVLGDTRRLLLLARVALDRGIAIRSFRHGPRTAGGIARCPLIPLSARAQYFMPARRPPRTAESFLVFALLTTVNRESLVFYLSGSQGQPGVLFTADSDLRDANLGAVQPGSIITAPHHGSGDNRDAYGRVSGPMVWVRSDQYSEVRPCREYLSAPGQRFCTLCRKSVRPKQAVRLHARAGTWVPQMTAPCSCR